MSNDNTIKRWDMDREYEYPDLEQYKDGEYVLYSDHIEYMAKLEKERDAYKQALQEIEKLGAANLAYESVGMLVAREHE